MLYGGIYKAPSITSQPYSSAMGNLIMWDGRLDNRKELLAVLPNEIRDKGTELGVVAAAVDLWGTEALEKFRGDWAITIWDHRNRELTLARDYIGIRQLFYYYTPPNFLWCSILDVLISGRRSLTVCDEYVSGLFGLYPDAQLTPYKEIRSVPPGHLLRVHQGKISVHAYWQFDSNLKIRYTTDAEYEEQYRYLFRQAVRHRLQTDSPVLAELSGGLDSSSVVCMADDIMENEGADTPRLDTFSYFDPVEPNDDDFPYFTRIEQKRSRVGHHVPLGRTDETFASEYSNFTATPCLSIRQGIHLARAKATREGGYRVVVSGIGGDEFNGQALDIQVQLAELLRRFAVRELAPQLMMWSLCTRRPLVQLLSESFALLLPTWARRKRTGFSSTESWVSIAFAKEHHLSKRFLVAAEGRWHWSPGTRDALQTYSSLARQMSHERPTVYEVRYPYLDQDLTEFLMAIPTDQLLRDGHHRSLMRRALKQLVPLEILLRNTKSGGSQFIPVTLSHNWDRIESLLIAPLIARLGYVDEFRFRTALQAAKNGNISFCPLQLMRALYLELWLGKSLERGLISISSARPVGIEAAIRVSQQIASLRVGL
jgi:asparagine synthase (glutamine-hydrolysing)